MKISGFKIAHLETFVNSKSHISDIMKIQNCARKAKDPLDMGHVSYSRPCASDLSGMEGAAGTIVIGYRGTFAFGKDGLSDVKFRKLTRILVHGKVGLVLSKFSRDFLVDQSLARMVSSRCVVIIFVKYCHSIEKSTWRRATFFL